jgi:two-component system cell cycle response regulator
VARRTGRTAPTGRVVMVIDDNAEYLATVERLLTRDGHRVLTAVTGTEALAILRTVAVDLVLVDYFMPGMTGEDFVIELRRFDPMMQVVLQTGFATEQPPRQMLRRLDIQGYHDKNDGPEKLRLWVDVGLKAASALQSIAKSRQGLRYVISVTPELHRLQPLEGLLQAVIAQTAGLLATGVPVDAVAAAARTEDSGFAAMVSQPGGELVIRAGTGRFRGARELDACLDEGGREDLAEALKCRSIATLDDATILPLCVGETVHGVLYVERAAHDPGDRELLEIFASQVAMAIQNVGLYELAATDALTGVFSRRFLDQSLLRHLHQTGRSGAALSVLVIDMDGMKTINDVGGHAAGDHALTEVARVLRDETRASDVVGRVGGDEFVVVLPDTDADGASAVIERIARAMGKVAPISGVPIRVSVGSATVIAPRPARIEGPSFYLALQARLIGAADDRLYVMKRGRILARGAQIPWSDGAVSDVTFLTARAS